LEFVKHKIRNYGGHSLIFLISVASFSAYMIQLLEYLVLECK